MKNFAFLIALSLALPQLIFAQGSRVACTELQAFAFTNPPVIRLEWTPAANATNAYSLYRKAKTATTWGSPIAAIPLSDSIYEDSTVALGGEYEYKLVQTGFSFYGNDYIYAGVEVPAADYLGKMILVIDTTYYAGLETEVLRLEEDLWGDGWQVIRLLVDRTDSVASVKTSIQAIYYNDSVHTKSVFLLGHVPVPYSGNIAPDGHGNHVGAWPADLFYGEMNGNWTDISVNNTSAARTANHNVPADGKYDQNTMNSALEMSVGRVDMANMSSYPKSEEELLRHYLDKDHAWRHKEFSSAEKGVVDENFNAQTYGYFGASGFRNFGPLVGSANVTTGDYRTNLNAQDVMWSYGCGGGTYTSAGGIGSTSDFVGDSLRGVFTMLFGSYHGDWDSPNNFMRASLANKGTILNCAWAGRPAWFFHHMGLGTPIGQSMMASTNFYNTYTPGSYARSIHIALMGDPGLRMHVLSPPANLVATPVNGDRDVLLTWAASPDSNMLGYHIYRQDTLDGRFWQVNSGMVTANTYTDACLEPGNYRYMVRAVELRTCRSGSYFNLSQGIFDTVTVAPVFALQNPVLNKYSFCPDDFIWMEIGMASPFCDANAFILELSDSNGNFSNAIPLGSTSATTTDTVFGQMNGIASGTGYMVRLRSTSPEAFSDSIPVTILDLPVPNFIVQFFGDSIQCINTSTGATSYLWNFGDGNTSTAVSPGHVYTSSGTFLLTLAATGICGSSSNGFSIGIVGIEETLAGANDFVTWPNPSSGRLFLSWPIDSGESRILTITDLRGAKLRQWVNPQTEINLENLPSGTYLLELESEGRFWRSKVILRR